MEQQDIFIAYHGTYDNNGSLAKAKELFYYLQSMGIKCYFFPNQNNDYFANTPIAAQKSDKFLFVCNNNVDVNEDGSIRNNGVFQEITAFWNCIYEGKRKRGDAKVYAFDGFTSERANELHLAFQGVAHFDENLSSQEKTFEEVAKWVSNSSDDTSNGSSVHAEEAKPLFDGTSSELKKVFVRRSTMNKSWDLRKMICVAEKIECLGISNNEITLKMDSAALLEALERGAQIEVLFLDPKGKNTRLREKEESQEKNTIVNNTQTTLKYIMRIKKHNELGKVFDNLKVYVYDSIPRMNMIFIDGKHLLLQYYANNVPGASNPCFYIKKQAENQVYDFYYNQYKVIREGGKELK